MGETKRESWDSCLELPPHFENVSIVASAHKLIFLSVSFVYPLFIYLFWFQMLKNVKRSYLPARYKHGHNILRLSDIFANVFFIISEMMRDKHSNKHST